MSEPFVPPPGSENDDRSSGFQAFIIAMTVMTISSIALRFWSRGLRVRGNTENGATRFWWDDWMALAAVPFILSQFGVEFVMVHLGLGRHVWTLSEAELAKFLKLLYSIYFIYDIALFLTKTSALLFFSRVFPAYANANWFNHALRITHLLNLAWLIGIVFGTVFMCNPVEKGWNPFIPGQCGPTSALWIGSAVPSVAIDLIILALPLPKIWGLQMSRGRKIGLTFVFLLGYCVIIVSLGRMITLLTTGEGLNTDITYLGIPVSIWVSAEAPVVLLCICLPAMLPLGRHLASTYLSPLASKVSSLLGSHGGTNHSTRSKRREFNSTTDISTVGIRLRTTKPTSEERVYNSLDSERGMLPTQSQYTAHINGGEQQREGMKNAPHHSIRVERQFKVNQLER